MGSKYYVHKTYPAGYTLHMTINKKKKYTYSELKELLKTEYINGHHESEDVKSKFENCLVNLGPYRNKDKKQEFIYKFENDKKIECDFWDCCDLFKDRSGRIGIYLYTTAFRDDKSDKPAQELEYKENKTSLDLKIQQELNQNYDLKKKFSILKSNSNLKNVPDILDNEFNNENEKILSDDKKQSQNLSKDTILKEKHPAGNSEIFKDLHVSEKENNSENHKLSSDSGVFNEKKNLSENFDLSVQEKTTNLNFKNPCRNIYGKFECHAKKTGETIYEIQNKKIPSIEKVKNAEEIKTNKIIKPSEAANSLCEDYGLKNCSSLFKRKEFEVEDSELEVKIPIFKPPTTKKIYSEEIAELKLSVDEIDEKLLSFTGLRLGTGGQGVVSKAKYLGTTVAVKSIAKRDTATNKLTLREIKLLDSIRHPNFIFVMAVSQNPTQYHLILEFFDSHNLSEILRDKDIKQIYGLDKDKKNKIGKEICTGINYLHKKFGIVHRDIKPNNILVNTNLDVKICDLGLSRSDNLNEDLMSTTTGTIRGTYIYMSPEILLHNKKAVFSSDVWSFGCTVVEIYSEKYV